MAETELDELASQFRNSEEALVQAREKLDGLAVAEESVASTSEALTEAAQRIKEFSDQASEAVERLRAVAANAAGLLDRGTQLLSGNELSELRASVDGLGASVEARLAALEEKAANVERAEAEKAALQGQLDHLKTNIAPRHLKKALDSYPG